MVPLMKKLNPEENVTSTAMPATSGIHNQTDLALFVAVWEIVVLKRLYVCSISHCCAGDSEYGRR